MAWKPDICIYHGNCPDGFGAAWAVRSVWPDCTFEPGVYGKDPDIDITKMNVLLVDFSYKYPQLFDMAQQAASLVVIDHHKSAQADLARLPSFDGSTQGMEAAFQSCEEIAKVACWFDMEQSGAVMAWKFAQQDERAEVPELLLTIQDRDLWRFDRANTREISALLSSYPQDFEIWNDLITNAQFEAGRIGMANEGAAILRKHDKDVQALIKSCKRTMVIGGVEVPVANVPYQFASDAAGTMAKDAPFAAVYYDRWDGKRSFSLRSRGDAGKDVSVIALLYGGGGHRNASGFSAPQGWEGDEGSIPFD